MPSSHTPAAAPPKQTRSLQSLNRMLDATERLLADRSFDDLTIQDVVKEARTSVGVFYSRFADKETLLDAVYQRHQAQVAEELEAYRPEHWRDASVAEIVRHRVAGLIARYRNNRGLYRALVMRGHERPDERYADPKSRDALGVGNFSALIAAHKNEVGHPKPKDAAALAYLMVMAALREKILFGDSTASAVRLSDKRLEDELVRAVLAYLEA